MPATEEQVAALLPKVLRMAQRYQRRYTGGDAESAALLGLARAARAYDPRKRIAFSTFAYACVKNALSQDRAAAGCHADPERECSLDMDLGEHVEGNALLGRDLIADPSDPIAELLAQMDLEARLAQMHSSEAGIVQSLLAGETIRGIARAVGVSHQAVWKRRKQALKTWQRLGQEV